MALDENGGTQTVLPVAPMGYGGNGGGFADGFGGWWIILLLLCFGGMWGGNGMGGMNGIYPWMNQAAMTQGGFNQAATDAALSGIQTSIVSGFGDVQNALCGGFAGVNANLNNGFAQAEIANNSRQMANMQQGFGMQTAITGGLNNLSSQLANCCCENRLATQALQAVIQQENCADRAAISDGIRDVLVANNANTQRILDVMCQNKLDEKNEKIADLQRDLSAAQFAASQVAQNNYLQNALTAQTQYFLSLYPPTANATGGGTATTGT